MATVPAGISDEGRDRVEANRCLILVVLYRVAPLESETVRGIVAALQSSASLRGAFAVLLWDNSPAGFNETPHLPDGFEYRHAATNDGIAGACNAAAELCKEFQHEWLLVLDQDTQVTSEYLHGMLRHLLDQANDARVAAIVPLLLEGEFPLSPQQVLRYRQKPVQAGLPRLLDGEVFAANSGSMLRVADLLAIGGYSLDFWLDHSDMYVFHLLFLRGKRVYLAADQRLQHSMTMLDYDARMTPERYDNFLHAEQAFLDLFKTPMQNTVQIFRLLVRVFRQRRYRNPEFSRMTLRFLLWRLGASRAARLRAWKERSAARQRGAARLAQEGIDARLL